VNLAPALAPLNLLSGNNFRYGDEHGFNLVWLLIFSLSLFLVGMGLRDPWPADEPRFALVAKEMVETGQWFFPMRGGELYPDKPPVFMWSIAIFYWLTGSLRIAFLLPSALCSTLALFLVYDLGRRLWSNRVGWYAALLLLLSMQFTLQAKMAQIDAMVTCWITIGCYGLLRFILLGGGWRWYFLAWFFMGIGVITKGVGFLPLLMLLPYAALRIFNITDPASSLAEKVGGWRWLAGPVVMLGAVSLWFLPMLYLVEQYQDPLFNAYRDNILLKQTVTRYADSWHHRNPFWYYLISVIPFFWLPISLMLPWLVKHWKEAVMLADRRIILPLGWAVLVLLFFSLSPGKRGVYILPALPMLALVSAPYLLSVLDSKWFNRLILIVVLALSLLFLLFGIAGKFNLDVVTSIATRYRLEPWNFSIVLGAAGVAVVIFNFKRHRFASWIMFIPVLWIMLSTWGYVLLNPIRTPQIIYQQIAHIVPRNAELALPDFSEQFILFSPYRTTHFGYRTADDEEIKAAWLWQQKTPHGFILLNHDFRTTCFDMDKAIPLGHAHRKNWVLLDQNSRLETCDAPVEAVIEYHYQPPGSD